MNPGKMMSLEEAIAAGKKFYYSGIACAKCYSMGMRRVAGDVCVNCDRVERKKAWNRLHRPPRGKQDLVKCPCGGDTTCVTRSLLKDGTRKSYQQCKECKRVWICRNGVIEGKSSIGEKSDEDGRKNNGGRRMPKPTIPGARVILGRCMSGSD